MIVIVRSDGEIELVTTVCRAVPTGGHSHHLLHLLLAVGQVGQETALRLLPWRAVGHAQPLPLLSEGVGQVTYLGGGRGRGNTMCVAKRQTLVCPVVSCTSPCTALSPLTRGPARDSIRAGTVTFRVVFNGAVGGLELCTISNG